MNSTFTDSTIPIHALTTIRLFTKQITLLNDFPGGSGTADSSGEQTRAALCKNIKLRLLACQPLALLERVFCKSFLCALVLSQRDSSSTWPRCSARLLGSGQSTLGVNRESAARDAPPPNVGLQFSSSNSKFTDKQLNTQLFIGTLDTVSMISRTPLFSCSWCPNFLINVMPTNHTLK